MTKRPSYQWYPGDFRRDTAVQSCSFDARALWREMLDIMHDGEPYGHLTGGGVPIEPPELSRMVGLEMRRLRPALAELERKNVLSRTPEGVIYSRRMVRDEDIRQKRAAGGKLGGNPALMDKGEDTAKVEGKVNLPPNLSPTPAVCSLQSAQQQNSAANAAEPPAREDEPTAEQPPFDRNAYHGEIAKVLRATFPDGKTMPRERDENGDAWTMARELSIADNLVEWNPPDEIVAAAKEGAKGYMARGRHFTLRAFQADTPKAQDFYRQMLAAGRETLQRNGKGKLTVHVGRVA